MKIAPPILCATMSLIATAAAAQSVSPKLPVYKDPKAPIEKRIDDLLKRMTLEEKLNQLRCDRDAWEKFIGTTGYGQTLDILRPMKNLPAALRANEVQRMALKSRLGIPIVIHDEALHGLIGDGTTSFPQSIAMAATWNPAMTGRVAAAIAEESRARGVRHVLAPVINVIRDARWGRVEETYGEDPVLTSRMAVAYVKEFENRGVATNPKHYVVNAGDGGHDSYAIDISERQLREIYLPPFEAAIKEGGASSVMSSYNSYDGVAVSANRFLLTDILRGEWGFKGLVASDYGATEGILYNHHNVANEKEAAAAALNAGLDCEWPNVRIWGKGLDDAVKEGLISKKTLDQSVRRVLWVKFKTGMFEDPWANPEHVSEIVQSPAHRQIALDAARQAMTLLKNEGALPLKKSLKSIAVIGPYAKDGIPLGGYSGTDVPMVSVLDGIKAKVGPDTKVEWAQGASYTTERTFPAISGATFRNLKGEYFDNDKLQGAPKVTRNDLQLAFDWGNGSPDPAIPNDHFSARWTGQIVPEKSGDYTVALTGDDGVRLWVDGKLLVDDWSEHAPHTTQVPLYVEAGVPLSIKLEYFESSGQASVQLGWGLSAVERPEIDDAVELVKRSDVAVVVAGIVEGEGSDRAFLDLPGTQEEEIRRIAATGKPVVVVLIAGSPVTMGNWIDRVPAILDAWYPGQEGGTAIADVLFGDVNPGGKLPITFPRSVGQCPIYYELPPTGRGYDYVDLTGRPQFPFGFGLSYTTFAYSNLKIVAPNPTKNGNVSVSFDVENNGSVAGDEVPQLYIHQSVSSIVRPLKSLKEFTRIHLDAGEKKTITFTLKPEDRMIWNAKMKKVIESGQMEVMVGSSSEDIRLRGAYNEK